MCKYSLRRGARCTYAHAAELGHFENIIVAPDTVGPVQGWAFGCQAHCQGHNGYWQQQDKRSACARKLIAYLDWLVPIKFAPRQHLVELIQCGSTSAQLTCRQYMGQRTMRHRTHPKRCTDQRAGIKHHAPQCAHPRDSFTMRSTSLSVNSAAAGKALAAARRLHASNSATASCAQIRGTNNRWSCTKTRPCRWSRQSRGQSREAPTIDDGCRRAKPRPPIFQSSASCGAGPLPRQTPRPASPAPACPRGAESGSAGHAARP